jgi:5,5'-dehydrodivanillate O-demethylase
MMRKRFFAEIEVMAAGNAPGGVVRSANAAHCISLPNMARELNTEGVSLAEFNEHPLLSLRLKDFRFHYGQPPEVRQAFVEAMGIAGA